MNEEYAVYSVILNDLFVKDKDRNYQSLSAISDQTIPFYFPNTEILSSIQEETISDFEMKHSKSYKLYPRFNLSINYTLINTEKPEDHDLRRAIIYLSNVGFDKEKTQAVVYIDYKCGLCGFGMYLILEKENGLWKIKQTNKLWAS